VRRDGLRSGSSLTAESGGLSGAPLLARSCALVRLIASSCALPIIGAGGVQSGRDALALLRAGANLVQVYTAFVYGGPGLPARMARELLALRGDVSPD